MPLDAKHVARTLRERRRASGLTQADLAEKAGLAFETVSRLESGREPPSLRSVVALAEALGASVDDLVLTDSKIAGSSQTQVPVEVQRLANVARDLEPRLVRHLTALARALRGRQRGLAGDKRRGRS